MASFSLDDFSCKATQLPSNSGEHYSTYFISHLFYTGNLSLDDLAVFLGWDKEHKCASAIYHSFHDHVDTDTYVIGKITEPGPILYIICLPTRFCSFDMYLCMRSSYPVYPLSVFPILSQDFFPPEERFVFKEKQSCMRMCVPNSMIIISISRNLRKSV